MFSDPRQVQKALYVETRFVKIRAGIVPVRLGHNGNWIGRERQEIGQGGYSWLHIS